MGLGSLAIGLALLLATKENSIKKKQLILDESPETKELQECSKQKLLNILEDLRIEYTPYYTHYYHMLKALATEYAGKPILQKKLREKIQDKLESKVEEIQEQIIEKYIIEGGSEQLASWISYYSRVSEAV
jgi:hypothetical protein